MNLLGSVFKAFSNKIIHRDLFSDNIYLVIQDAFKDLITSFRFMILNLPNVYQNVTVFLLIFLFFYNIVSVTCSDPFNDRVVSSAN